MCTEQQKTKPGIKRRRDYAEIQAPANMLHRLKFRDYLNYKWSDFMDSTLRAEGSTSSSVVIPGGLQRRFLKKGQGLGIWRWLLRFGVVCLCGSQWWVGAWGLLCGAWFLWRLADVVPFNPTPSPRANAEATEYKAQASGNRKSSQNI